MAFLHETQENISRNITIQFHHVNKQIAVLALAYHVLRNRNNSDTARHWGLSFPFLLIP